MGSSGLSAKQVPWSSKKLHLSIKGKAKLAKLLCRLDSKVEIELKLSAKQVPWSLKKLLLSIFNPLKLITEEQNSHLTLLEFYSLHIDFFLLKHVICIVTLHLLQILIVKSKLILVLVKLYVGLGFELELEIELELELELKLELELGLEPKI